MKLIFSLFSYILLISLSQTLYAQTDSTHIVTTDSLLAKIANNTDQILAQGYTMEPYIGRFKMYQTENMYNLLKLDTATGRIEQVQWSLKDSEEMTFWVNSSDLSYTGKNGTFELYPTKNMYQFILLDTADGRTWHVQWGTKSKERWIQRIY